MKPFQSNHPLHLFRQRHNGSHGMTLIELVLGLFLIGILSAIAIPIWTNYSEKLELNQAKMDIRIIGLKVTAYFSDKLKFPDTLTEVGSGGSLDPWGNPYQYLNIGDGGMVALANARKDLFLVPLNSDYDLYSMGKDGESSAPLVNPVSWDDIIRANDGKFVGLASEY